MCGIIAYLGDDQASGIMLAGLARLEYRGYDSAGIAVMQRDDGSKVDRSGGERANGGPAKCQRSMTSGGGHRLSLVKTAGKVASLRTAVQQTGVRGTLGIAHTRWATHGPPTDVNAHPHTSFDGSLAVVHNGIVENFRALRTSLIAKGYAMASETDTELLAILIDDIRKSARPRLSLEESVRQALTQVDGAFGIAVISSDEPDTLIGVRRGSPLILGIGTDEFVLASDASAVVERTRDVIYLNDDELVTIRRGEGYQIKTLSNVQLVRKVEQLQMSLHDIQASRKRVSHTSLTHPFCAHVRAHSAHRVTHAVLSLSSRRAALSTSCSRRYASSLKCSNRQCAAGWRSLRLASSGGVSRRSTWAGWSM